MDVCMKNGCLYLNNLPVFLYIRSNPIFEANTECRNLTLKFLRWLLEKRISQVKSNGPEVKFSLFEWPSPIWHYTGKTWNSVT